MQQLTLNKLSNASGHIFFKLKQMKEDCLMFIPVSLINQVFVVYSCTILPRVAQKTFVSELLQGGIDLCTGRSDFKACIYCILPLRQSYVQ